MVEYLYERLQRRGYLQRDVGRMVNQDRNTFASLLLALGHGDAMITGVTRTFAQTIREVRRVLDPKPGSTPFGIHMMIGKNYTVFLADTTINERPRADELAHIAKETAAVARRLGHEPRVAFLSYSTFGNPAGNWLENIRDAVQLLDRREDVGFEYEGEMAPDAALNPVMEKIYPFSRLSGPANVLVMPGLQSANLSAKLLRELGGNAMIGPMLIGMEKPVQIAAMTSTAPDVLTLAVLAAGGIVALTGSLPPHMQAGEFRIEPGIIAAVRPARWADRADIAEQFLEQAALLAQGRSLVVVGLIEATCSMPRRSTAVTLPVWSKRTRRMVWAFGRGMLKARFRCCATHNTSHSR